MYFPTRTSLLSKTREAAMRQQQISRRPRARASEDLTVTVPTKPIVLTDDAADLVVRIDALLSVAAER